MCLQLRDRATLSRSKTQPRECPSLRQIILNILVPLMEDLEREQKQAWNKRNRLKRLLILLASCGKAATSSSKPSCPHPPRQRRTQPKTSTVLKPRNAGLKSIFLEHSLLSHMKILFFTFMISCISKRSPLMKI